MIERPFDSERKRFYLVSGDATRPTHDYDIVNIDELKVDSERPAMLFWSGPKKVEVFAGTDPDGYQCYYRHYLGFPDLPIKPVLKVASRGKPLDVYGSSGHTFLSTRAKELLESIDPEAFEFVECDVFTRNKVQLDPYWMMRIVRVVHAFEEQRSVFREVGGTTPIPSGQSPGLRKLYDIRMSPEMPDDYHAFYLLKYRAHYLFDEVLVDRWMEEKFSGYRFSPLQPLTKKEKKIAGHFLNYEYHFEASRKYWEDIGLR